MISESLIGIILEKLKSLPAEEFVNLIVEHLGCRVDFSEVEAGPPRGPDRKIDIVAERKSGTDVPRKVAFQCKRFRNTLLNATSIGETAVAIANAHADEGAIVSTVDPTAGAKDAIMNLEAKGIRIHYKEWCGRGLVLNLLVKTPSLLHRQFPDLHLPVNHLCPSFETVIPPADLREQKADKFYSGFPATWQDLQAKYDIERTVYTKQNGLKEQILDFLRGEAGLKIVALLGVAGTGKTTLLRRTGLDAGELGFSVLRLTADWLIHRVSLSRQINDVVQETGSPLLILIDNAADLVFEQNILEGTLREITASQPVVILVAEQPHRWNIAIRKIQFFERQRNYFVCNIHHLLPKECENLVDKILGYEKDGTLTHSYCSLSREERLSLCHDSAERQLLVAMLQMRHGLQFHKIIEREYEGILIREAQEAYAITCLFNIFGAALPRNLLMRSLRVTSPVVVQQFVDSTDGLFVDSQAGLSARHIIIARAVVSVGLASAEARKSALSTILSSLDMDDEIEAGIFLRMFAGQTIYRRLVTLLARKVDLIRLLYRDVRTSHGGIPPYYRKYLATSQAMAERLLGDPQVARGYLDEAIILDPKFAFAYRQYAWLEHFLGNWNKAAERALKAAVLAPGNFLCIYHCGRILSLNTVSNFRRAKEYLQRALEREPTDDAVIKSWNEYLAAELVLGYLAGLKDDELIREPIFKEMRPGLAFLRAVHGDGSSKVRQRLTSRLRGMEEQDHGELADLFDMIQGIKIGKDKILRALIACNVARLQYLEWYHNGEPHSPDEMEQLFKNSLELNPSDPFTHCWYGTFLKEVRENFTGARIEYDKALSLANKLKNVRLHDHPLFLNNIGLLIIDEYYERLRPADSLKEAQAAFTKAIERVKETGSIFVWPEISLSLCQGLMNEQGQ